MGKEDERELSFPTLKLQILPITAASSMHSPEHPSGMATPPLQTLASVPFKWEQEPGKPRPCTDIIIPIPQPAKSLELPPCRMLFMEPCTNKTTKTPSPTSVLDGPNNVGRPKFSSFRFFREDKDSFDSCSSASPEGSALDILLGSTKSGGQKPRGFFGKFRGGKKDVDGGSMGFSSSSTTSCDSDESCTRVNSTGEKMRRNGSFSSVSHARPSHLLASIYEGFKQVIHWKSSRKSNKVGQV